MPAPQQLYSSTHLDAEKSNALVWAAPSEHRIFDDLPLLWLLRQSRRLRCTNPRDKVFGLLGLIQDLTAEDLKVDYSLLVCAVYINAAKALTQHYGTLSWLCQTMLGHADDRHKFPTWLPDWSSDEYVYEIGDCMVRQKSACGTLAPGAVFSADERELRVTGFKVDEVLKICPTYFWRCSDSNKDISSHLHYNGTIIDTLEKTVRWTQTACRELQEADIGAPGMEHTQEFREWMTFLSGNGWRSITDAQRRMLSRTLVADGDWQSEAEKYQAFTQEVEHLRVTREWEFSNPVHGLCKIKVREGSL
jgi:hypothetical protein